MKMDAEEAVLSRMGLDFYAPAPGCCGMAGAFGFENDKYEISREIGELELFPPSATRVPKPSSFPTGLAAANRSPRKPDDMPCILRR